MMDGYAIGAFNSGSAFDEEEIENGRDGGGTEKEEGGGRRGGLLTL